MNVPQSLKAIQAWAIESLQEIQGKGSPVRVASLMKNINSEARKVGYRGSWLKRWEKILDDARGLNRGDPQKDPLKVRWLETSISLGREKLERDHNGIVSIQATAQNIIGLMEKVNSMKKNNPNTVFQLKSKLLYVEAEKYAGSLVKILTDLLSTEKKYETERLRFWSDFEEAIKYYRGLEKMSLKEARRRSFMHWICDFLH